MRIAAPVDTEQLEALALVEKERYHVLAYDQRQDKIMAAEQLALGKVVLSERKTENAIDDEKLVELWCEQIHKNGIHWLNWRDKDVTLLARWRWLVSQYPDVELTNVDDEQLLHSINTWLAPFLTGIRSKKALDKIDLSSALLSLLTYQQQQELDRLAPEYFKGPTGRRCPIRYSLEKHPIVSLPMQEVYGLAKGPSVGLVNAPISLTLELLSPAQRPIQITSDLAGFWQGSYSHVQKDMKAKYPKHYWPDDPANAQATNKTKRALQNQG